MIFNRIRWLWTHSVAVCGGDGIVLASRRIRFLCRSLLVYRSITPLIDAPQESPLGKLMHCRPETIGTVIWPYQCSGWNAKNRIARIRDHYAVVEKIGGLLDFEVDARIQLLDLDEIREGFRVIVDQPVWFMREGQLAINLFLGDTRIYTLAFSLFQSESGISAFIGAIQGRDIDGVLANYRELTKASHGMRPRDLLFEIFRMFCSELGVSQILAVSDEYRHHRYQNYFGQARRETFSSNYDKIWTDRGGVRSNPMFFQLEVGETRRDLSEVPAKKRSMYRRRYEMLSRIASQMRARWPTLSPRADDKEPSHAREA
jgi:uncharacterized protein